MIGEILTKLRKDLKLSQTAVAKKINVSAVNYNRYENNQRSPDNETLVLLADFFDVSIDYLLGRTSEKKYLSETENDAETNLIAAHATKDLTEEEQKKLIEFAEFLKSTRK